MQYTQRQTFKISVKQKQTLTVLGEKYKLNVSKFIRDAINEKLKREKETILKNYKEINEYISDMEECPF